MNQPFDRLKAALADRYALERELGRGGMATVYLAHDRRNDRKVAVKVLHPELAAILGAERFLQEIKVTANLQHPHILPLFDSGQADGFVFYVMPFIDGETLRRKLNQETQLPIAEAVRIATEVAGALDYAHRHGVIHRDIKPENILLHDGTSLVADFGIALAAKNAGGQRITETGLSLGTPEYMSPEQAAGSREIDGRSDIYSLGCVLYEMLAGEPPHTGPNAQAIIARILTEIPKPVTQLRPRVAQGVSRAIERALERLPADRFSNPAEFTAALRGASLLESSTARSQPSDSSSLVRRLLQSQAIPWLVAILALAVAVAPWTRVSRAGRPQHLSRFQIFLPASARVTRTPIGANVVLSPDGGRLAYTGINEKGQGQIFWRALDQLGPLPIPGTEDGYMPTFSPDGSSMAFVQGGDLKTVALNGGVPRSVTSVKDILGTSWGEDGVIVFGTSGDGLFAVPAAGGQPRRVTVADSSNGELGHRWPEVLPGAAAVVFTSWPRGGNGRPRVAVAELKTGRVKYLPLDVGSNPHFVDPGYLVYTDPQGTVFAAPFDYRRLEVTGTPVPVTRALWVGVRGAVGLGVSRTGTILAGEGTNTGGELLLVDRNGGARLLPFQQRRHNSPRFSPDGRRIAVDEGLEVGSSIWVYELSSGTSSRMTLGGTNRFPIWSPDGRRIAFASTEGAAEPDLHVVLTDGSGSRDTLFRGSLTQYPVLWSPDGQLFFLEAGQTGADFNWDVWVTPTSGAVTPRAFLKTGSSEGNPALSPDGNWLAYTSNETGRTEVYIRPYRGGDRRMISPGGGSEPLWARNGNELFYRNGDSVIAVTVGANHDFGTARRSLLFIGPYVRGSPGLTNYDVAPNGQHFIMVRNPPESDRLVILLNWFESAAARKEFVKSQ